jgi:hypothetical protein
MWERFPFLLTITKCILGEIHSYCFNKNKIRFLALLHGESRPSIICLIVFRKEIELTKFKEGYNG